MYACVSGANDTVVVQHYFNPIDHTPSVFLNDSVITNATGVFSDGRIGCQFSRAVGLETETVFNMNGAFFHIYITGDTVEHTSTGA